MNAKKMLLEYHSTALETYLKMLEDGIDAKESIAYNIFMHSGMLYRYTANNSYIERLRGMKGLLYDAFRYVRALELTELLKEYVGREDINEVVLADLEHLIGARDDLEAFCDAVFKTIADDISEGRFKYVSELAHARSYANEFDQIAGLDSGLMSVAAADFSWLRDIFAVECKREDYWWVYLSEEFEEAEERICDWIESFSGSSENVPATAERPKYGKLVIIAEDFLSRISKLAELPAAAAEDGARISAVVVWDGRSDALVENSQYTYAELVDPLAKDEERGAYAQWKINGMRFSEGRNLTFYLLAKKTGKVIGTGLIDDEGFAQLYSADWSEIKDYTDSYEELVLLVLEKEGTEQKVT